MSDIWGWPRAIPSFWVVLGPAESRWDPPLCVGVGGCVSPVSLFPCVCTAGLEHGAHLPARARHSCRKQLTCGPGETPRAAGSDWKRGCPQAAPAGGRIAENPWGEWSSWWSFVKLELPWFWGVIMCLVLKWQVPSWGPLSSTMSVRRIPPVFKNSFFFLSYHFILEMIFALGVLFFLEFVLVCQVIKCGCRQRWCFWNLKSPGIAVFHGWDMAFPNVIQKGKTNLVKPEMENTSCYICLCSIFLPFVVWSNRGAQQGPLVPDQGGKWAIFAVG